jgi:hypothetical protein
MVSMLKRSPCRSSVDRLGITETTGRLLNCGSVGWVGIDPADGEGRVPWRFSLGSPKGEGDLRLTDSLRTEFVIAMAGRGSPGAGVGGEQSI